MSSKVTSIDNILKTIVPKELQCLGFTFSDLDLSFKKSQVQLGLYYKDVQVSDKEICEAFKEELSKSPAKIMSQIKAASEKANEHMEQMKEKGVDRAKEIKNPLFDEL
jgi:type II secretory pathway component PulC